MRKGGHAGNPRAASFVHRARRDGGGEARRAFSTLEANILRSVSPRALCVLRELRANKICFRSRTALPETARGPAGARHQGKILRSTESEPNINKLARGKFTAVFLPAMSERNWGLIIAAGLGVVSFSAAGGFVLAGQTYSERQQVEASDRAPRDKGGLQQADTDHAGVPALVERIISNPEPRDDAEREKRDLAAQENTAAWTFWIVVLAAIQSALSAVGILFIVRSLRQAEASLNHAREVSHTDFRPWIQISVEPDSGYNDPEAVRFFCLATLKNLGRTPAQDVRVGTTAASIPVAYYEKYGPQERLTMAQHDMHKWQPILPGGEITRLVSFEVKWDDAEAIREEGPRYMCPYFGVHVTYALSGDQRGETVATFQIGLADKNAHREMRGFDATHERKLSPLLVQEGVRGKIT